MNLAQLFVADTTTTTTTTLSATTTTALATKTLPVETTTAYVEPSDEGQKRIYTVVIVVAGFITFLLCIVLLIRYASRDNRQFQHQPLIEMDELDLHDDDDDNDNIDDDDDNELESSVSTPTRRLRSSDSSIMTPSSEKTVKRRCTPPLSDTTDDSSIQPQSSVSSNQVDSTSISLLSSIRDSRSDSDKTLTPTSSMSFLSMRTSTPTDMPSLPRHEDRSSSTGASSPPILSPDELPDHHDDDDDDDDVNETVLYRQKLRSWTKKQP